MARTTLANAAAKYDMLLGDAVINIRRTCAKSINTALPTINHFPAIQPQKSATFRTAFNYDRKCERWQASECRGPIEPTYVHPLCPHKPVLTGTDQTPETSSASLINLDVLATSGISGNAMRNAM